MFENMKSDLELIKHAIANGDKDSLITAIKEYITNKFTSETKGLLSQQVLTREQITRQAIELLGIPDPEQELKKPEMSLYHELEIFSSNDKTETAPETYFNRICLCKSISGREYFKSILMTYTDDLEVLHRRQSNLAYFHNLDPGMHRYLAAALTQFSTHEPVIFWNIGDKSPEMQQVLDMIFFTKSWTRFLNYKPGFMGVYYYLLMIISPIWGIISPFVFFFVPYLFARYIIKIPIPFEYYTKQMQDMLFGKQFFAMIGVAQKVFTAFYMGPDNTATLKTKLIDKLFVLLQTGLARWLYLFVILASYLYGIYNYIVSSMNYNKLLNFIHDRIKHIRILVDSSVICLSLLESQTHNCNELAQIRSACYKLLNENEYIQYLRSENVCMSEPSFFSSKGPIIKAYYMLEQIDRKEVLAPFIRLYAWIDTWMNTAELLSIPKPLCLVEWNISSVVPTLNITDCWSIAGGDIGNSLNLSGVEVTSPGTEVTAPGVEVTSPGTEVTESLPTNNTDNNKESGEPKPEPVEPKPEAVEPKPEAVEPKP